MAMDLTIVTLVEMLKRNQCQCYINASSNHSRHVFKYIPNGIMVRLSTYSSDIDILTPIKHEYKAALKKQWL